MIDQKTIWDHFSKWEVIVPHMYLDSSNFVTVGIGHWLVDSADAEDQPFVFRKDRVEVKDGRSVVTATKGQVATRKEIAAEYAHVELFARKNWRAKAFEQETYLELTSDDIEALFGRDIAEKIKTLTRILPEIDLYPSDAQLVLLDLIYNGYLVKGSALFKAAKAKDWELAAKLCPTTKNKGRDTYRKELFRGAATEEKQQKEMDPEAAKGRPRNISSPFQCTIPDSSLLIRQRSVPPR